MRNVLTSSGGMQNFFDWTNQGCVFSYLRSMTHVNDINLRKKEIKTAISFSIVIIQLLCKIYYIIKCSSYFRIQYALVIYLRFIIIISLIYL